MEGFKETSDNGVIAIYQSRNSDGSYSRVLMPKNIGAYAFFNLEAYRDNPTDSDDDAFIDLYFNEQEVEDLVVMMSYWLQKKKDREGET